MIATCDRDSLTAQSHITRTSISGFSISTPLSLYLSSLSLSQSEFGKIYECPVERAKHEAVFAQKVARVRAHNEAYARGEASWFAAVNQFTDMTEAEVAKFKGHKKSRPSEHSAAALGELKFTDLPASVDWRAQNVVSPVKDQGGCVGSRGIRLHLFSIDHCQLTLSANALCFNVSDPTSLIQRLDSNVSVLTSLFRTSLPPCLCSNVPKFI